MVYTTKGLDKVKVGDKVAPIIESNRLGCEQRWGGPIYEVTNVGKRRFKVLGKWVDKSTGREVGSFGQSTLWVLVTPKMQKEYDEKQATAEREKREKEAYNARPDVQAARELTNIDTRRLIQVMTLEEMTGILDRYHEKFPSPVRGDWEG